MFVLLSQHVLKRSTFVKYMGDGAIKISKAATNLLSSEIIIMIPTLNMFRRLASATVGQKSSNA